jgi:hypothetical protein
MRKQHCDQANSHEIPEGAYEKTFAHSQLVDVNYFGTTVCGGGIFETVGAFGDAMGRQIPELGISGGISVCRWRSGDHKRTCTVTPSEQKTSGRFFNACNGGCPLHSL